LPAFLVIIKHHEEDLGGSKLLMMLFALIWINDAAAYFAGNFWGKRKLAPVISPSKTIEGFLGGVSATIILGIVLSFFSPVINFKEGLILGIIIGFAAPAGDLAESALKRGAGLKDSGVLIPGHGGILDRLDSVLFGAPIFLLFILWKIGGFPL
jgi:phosphatidate cytidylyltransferase